LLLTKGVGTYLVNYNADNTLAAFRFAHDDLVIHAAEAHFANDDRGYNAGTLVIREADNPMVDLETVLKQAGAEYGLSPPAAAVPTNRTSCRAGPATWAKRASRPSGKRRKMTTLRPAAGSASGRTPTTSAWSCGSPSTPATC